MDTMVILLYTTNIIKMHKFKCTIWKIGFYFTDID